MALTHGPGHDVVLVFCQVTDLEFQRRQCRWNTCYFGPVQLAQLVAQHTDGPAVDDDVMHRHHQQELSVPQVE